MNSASPTTPSVFGSENRRILGLLGVTAGEAAMVGDTLEDDIHGAQAIGMRAVLAQAVPGVRVVAAEVAGRVAAEGWRAHGDTALIFIEQVDGKRR